MSTECNELESKNNHNVNVTSFNGGVKRGKCLQLTQVRSTDLGYVQLDREQVMQLVADGTRWLAGE